ncbi:MAG: hypothetical protein ACYDBH_00225 [Acidobacteriaceae bacterium]
MPIAYPDGFQEEIRARPSRAMDDLPESAEQDKEYPSAFDGSLIGKYLL